MQQAMKQLKRSPEGDQGESNVSRRYGSVRRHKPDTTLGLPRQEQVPAAVVYKCVMIDAFMLVHTNE